MGPCVLTRSVRAAIDDLLEWLESEDCRVNGVLCGWRSASAALATDPYPEICGYYLTLGDTESRARRYGPVTSSWLVDRVERGEFRGRSQSGDRIYLFDLAMMATGLLLYYNRERDQAAKYAAGTLIRLITLAIESQEKLTPLLWQAGMSNPDRSSWSTCTSAHLLKVVQCLLVAKASLNIDVDCAISTLIRHIRSYSNVMDAVSLDGRRWLHPLMYYVEGLWITGEALGRRALLDHGRRILMKVWTQQLATGGFPAFIWRSGNCGQPDPPEQTDVLAQVLRCSLLIGAPVPAVALESSVGRLLASLHERDAGRAATYRPAARQSDLNSWASMFAVQALRLYSGAKIDWWNLV